MSLRYGIEFCFVFLMTLQFQYEIGLFNRYLHMAKKEIYIMKDHKAIYGKDDFYHHEMEILHYELHHAAVDLQKALMVSYV